MIGNAHNNTNNNRSSRGNAKFTLLTFNEVISLPLVTPGLHHRIHSSTLEFSSNNQMGSTTRRSDLRNVSKISSLSAVSIAWDLNYQGFIRWLLSNFQDCKMWVKVRNALGPSVKIQFGVPQASVLGTFLYTAFIESIDFDINHVKVWSLEMIWPSLKPFRKINYLRTYDHIRRKRQNLFSKCLVGIHIEWNASFFDINDP